MLFLCPGCQRSFDEAGFCPFDRTPLVSMSEARTIVTGPMRAVSGPHTTALERPGTLPITPAPAPTDEVTAPRRPAAPDATEVSAVRAVSAAQDAQRALASYDGERDSEYDRLVGQTLDGRYHIQKKIGEGGMGVVFAARHAVIERPLAIKVLKREVMRDAATIRRFVQEAKAASRIGHPNIVDVTDFGTTPDGMTYSVMEYVDGETLGRALRYGAPFGVPRTVRIAAQIARALGAAHDKGIVHRDLKPENVFLVDRDGRPDFVKIVDFGIAKVAPLPGQRANEPRLTRAGSVFGTPEYMAPEQAAGRGDTDGRVDIYALGVILYEMVTGRVPHKGDTMVRTLAMQMLDPAVPPSRVRPDLEISADLEALILKALAKKREQRFQTMGELLAAIDALQVPVGLSVTGSPVYALVPLPPGADPALAAAGVPATPLPGAVPVPATPFPVPSTPFPMPATPFPVPSTPAPMPGASAPVPAVQPVTGAGPAAPPRRRLKDEPEFVARDKLITFDHVATEPRAAPGRRPWPTLLLFALILGGAAGALALILEGRRLVAEGSQDPASSPPPPPPPAPDAAMLAVAPPPALDAASAEDHPPPADAAAITAIAQGDDARRPLALPAAADAAIAAPPPEQPPVEIQVLTRPEGAKLFANGTYRAPSGSYLRETLGTTLVVTCKLLGYKDGVVKLVFDGTRKAAMCILERNVICIPGIHNPFDHCLD